MSGNYYGALLFASEFSLTKDSEKAANREPGADRLSEGIDGLPPNLACELQR